jgi:hypothetical protein
LCRRELLEAFHDGAGVLQWFAVSAPEIRAFRFLRSKDEGNFESQSSLHRKGV